MKKGVIVMLAALFFLVIAAGPAVGEQPANLEMVAEITNSFPAVSTFSITKTTEKEEVTGPVAIAAMNYEATNSAHAATYTNSISQATNYIDPAGENMTASAVGTICLLAAGIMIVNILRNRRSLANIIALSSAG